MIEVVIKLNDGAECGGFVITDADDIIVFDRGLEIELGGGAEASIQGSLWQRVAHAAAVIHYYGVAFPGDGEERSH